MNVGAETDFFFCVYLVNNHKTTSRHVVFVSPWHVSVSVEMVKPEGQAQEKPPMTLLQE